MNSPVRTYNPTTNLLDGIRTLFPLEICPWDDYYLRMAQSDFFLGRHKTKASKTAFIRKAPFGGSYAHLGGLTSFLRTLQDFRFDAIVKGALLDMGYKKEFVDYLCTEHDHVDVTVYAPPEGSIIFPNEPEAILIGSLLDVRIAEGMFLPCVNYPSLALTKWARVIQAANPGMTMEFARRRAQDILRTSLMAYLAGADITSNADLRAGIKVVVKGTMGHEWIQSFGDEFESFDKWLEINPDRPVLLVDTIDTLRSGLPNAIKAFKKHWERIKAAGGVPGIRNDSGDLAYITIEERKALDDAGLKEVFIFQTNDLDEYSIETIREQIYTHAPRAGLDPTETIRRIVWACGTQPGTCSDQSSIGGVAKLSSIEHWGKERAVIKIAHDNPIKTSIPGSNRSTWIRHKNTGEIFCCLIHDQDEDPTKCTVARHPDDELKKTILQFETDLEFIPRQRIAFQGGKIMDGFNPDVADVRTLVKTEESMLHWTLKRLKSPHAMKVSLSDKVYTLRKKLISNNQLMDK
jgi:nicotinate phosphoribosyltransferase